MDFMIPYHFFIIWMLSLLSTATHVGTLLALVQDFKRDWVLRWIRQFFMFVNLILSCVSGIFLLFSTMRNLPQTLPIACVWQVKSHGAAPNSNTLDGRHDRCHYRELYHVCFGVLVSSCQRETVAEDHSSRRPGHERGNSGWSCCQGGLDIASVW